VSFQLIARTDCHQRPSTALSVTDTALLCSYEIALLAGVKQAHCSYCCFLRCRVIKCI